MADIKKDYYLLGAWNAICDRCERKRKSTELRRTWQGYYVCQEHFEERHPQDFVKARPEKEVPDFARLEGEDISIADRLPIFSFTPPAELTATLPGTFFWIASGVLREWTLTVQISGGGSTSPTTTTVAPGSTSGSFTITPATQGPNTVSIFVDGELVATFEFVVLAAPPEYPPLNAIPLLLRFESPNGTQANLVNSGYLGGTASTEGTTAVVTTAVSKFGAGALRRFRQAGLFGLTHYLSPALNIPLGTSWTGGMWVISTFPAGSTELRDYAIYLSGNSFVNSFVFAVSVWPSQFGMSVGLGAPGSGIGATTSITPNEWYYLEGCLDGPTNIGYVFINGILVASGDVGTSRPAATGGVGSRDGTPGSTFPNNATQFLAVDNVFSIPGICIHKTNFTPPGDFV